MLTCSHSQLHRQWRILAQRLGGHDPLHRPALRHDPLGRPDAPQLRLRHALQLHRHVHPRLPGHAPARDLDGRERAGGRRAWRGDGAAEVRGARDGLQPRGRDRDPELLFRRPRRDRGRDDPCGAVCQYVLVRTSFPLTRHTNDALSALAASRVGHLRFTFSGTQTPYVLVEATRAQVLGSADPTNVTYPLGALTIDPFAREVYGSNPERQDFLIDPHHATTRWSGYFVARFDHDFASFGIAQNGTINEGAGTGEGALLSGFVRFEEGTEKVEVRVGVSFISVEQARANLDKEIPDGTALEETAHKTRGEWAEKMDRVRVEGAGEEQAVVFYTGIFHTLQVRGSLYLSPWRDWDADKDL